MKYLKMLSLAAVTAAALVASGEAGSASATVFCKETPTEGSPATTGTVCPEGAAYGKGTVIHAVTTEKMQLITEFKKIECNSSTLQGQTQGEGGATETVTLAVETLTFEGCNCEVKVLQTGTQEAHWIADTFHGTITASGQELTATCNDPLVGKIHCIY